MFSLSVVQVVTDLDKASPAQQRPVRPAAYTRQRCDGVNGRGHEERVGVDCEGQSPPKKFLESSSQRRELFL